MLRTFKSKLAATLVGVAVLGLAVAANVYYAGYNPNTNQTGLNGLETYGGATPLTTGSSCGTFTLIGGTTLGEIDTAAVTTCTIVLTVPPTAVVVSGGNPGAAAPNRLSCTLKDITHPAANVLLASPPTSSVCTFTAATITAGDVLQYDLRGY